MKIKCKLSIKKMVINKYHHFLKKKSKQKKNYYNADPTTTFNSENAASDTNLAKLPSSDTPAKV